MTTLTEKEQAKTLSKSKRKRAKRAPKIVLCNPFPKYWPLINEIEMEVVINLLQNLLVKEHVKSKIPWKRCIKLTKSSRKVLKQEMTEKEPISAELQNQRKHVKVGLNAVARAIHKTKIDSCLLAGDTEPEILISHLVTLASTRGVPVLIVPKLKASLSKIIGLSSTAVGIRIKDDGEYLKPLDALIKRFASQFPVPSHHAWVRDKAKTENDRTVKRARKTKNIHSDTNSKSEDNADSMIGDFYIDVTPTPSSETNICRMDTEDRMCTDEFISLNSTSNAEQLKKSSRQLYQDYVDNLLYIAPNFMKMQKNCNKQRKKNKYS